jgi:hypothetical protein
VATFSGQDQKEICCCSFTLDFIDYSKENLSRMMNTASFFGSAVYMPFTGFLLNVATSTHPGSYSFGAYRTLLIAFLLSTAAAPLLPWPCSRTERLLRHPWLKEKASVIQFGPRKV